MKREHFNHDLTQSVWNVAKAEARKTMIAVARREDLTAYSDLAAHITSCTLEPHDPRLARMLGDISTEEDEAGRGMLSVKPWSTLGKLTQALRKRFLSRSGLFGLGATKRPDSRVGAAVGFGALS